MAAISYRFPSSSLLGSVRMVDSSAVMGHDALQRPSWPQAQRRASHRQHDGSQADKVKDHRRRQGRGLPHGPHLVMLLSVSAVMAQHRLGSPEKSRRLSKRLSFAAPSSNCSGCLQKELRYDIGSAMQNRVLSSLRFADQNSLTRSVASFWTPHSARAFLPSATAALGVPKEQRDYLGGWSAQGSDNYSRVAARMISNLQKLVISSRQSSSGDPFAEADTASQLDDHLCPKGYSVEDRAKCFKGLESTIPLRPQQELEELRLKKENSRKQQTWNQSPKGMTKHRQSQKSRKTKGSKARTPSQNLWGQTPKQLVNSQEPSFRKATTSQHQAGTVQEYSTGWEPASWYQASTTHGTSTWVP